MGVRGVVVAILPAVRLAVAIVSRILMMLQGHALSRRDGCQALGGDCQSQQRDGEQAEERPRHR